MINQSAIHRFLIVLMSLAFSFLGGCGGSSSTSSATTSTTVPSGVSGSAVASTALSSSSGSSYLDLPLPERMRDTSRTLFAALERGDMLEALELLVDWLPIDKAFAATKTPKAKVVADYIETVAKGTATPTRGSGASRGATELRMGQFFDQYSRADCYGPQVDHDNHNDTGSGQDPLPTGDVGIWLSTQPSGSTNEGKPCAAAQLEALGDPIGSRVDGSMMLVAYMRGQVTTSSTLSMPASGATTDIGASVMNTFIDTILETGYSRDGNVTGTISNASGVYTYTLVVSVVKGSDNGKLAIQIVHDGTSAASSGTMSGRLTYASSTGSNSCNDGGIRATAGTVRYQKTSTTNINVSARESEVCIANLAALTATFSDYVSLDSNNELDPTVIDGDNLVGSTPTGATTNDKGWTAAGGGTGFNRFGASFNPDTMVGSYKYAWQAGRGDSHSRMFAMSITKDTSTDAMAAKGYFGFSGSMGKQGTATGGSSTERDIKGMICNWTGPGADASGTDDRFTNSGSTSKFQFQSLTLSSTDTEWQVAEEDITFAPTNNCNSTGSMTYDVDADGTISSGEGQNVTNDLDTLDSGTTTVLGTMENRGFTSPSLF